MVFKKRTKNHQVGDTAPQAGTVKVANRKNNRKKLALLSVAILLATIGVVSTLTRDQTTSSNETSNPCATDSEQLRKNAPNLKTNSRAELKPLVEAIERSEGYETNPDCLLPVSVYYIHASDVKKAETSLAMLEKSLESGQLSSYFTDVYPDALENLNIELKGLKQRDKELKESVIYF